MNMIGVELMEYQIVDRDAFQVVVLKGNVHVETILTGMVFRNFGVKRMRMEWNGWPVGSIIKW